MIINIKIPKCHSAALQIHPGGATYCGGAACLPRDACACADTGPSAPNDGRRAASSVATIPALSASDDGAV